MLLAGPLLRDGRTEAIRERQGPIAEDWRYAEAVSRACIIRGHLGSHGEGNVCLHYQPYPSATGGRYVQYYDINLMSLNRAAITAHSSFCCVDGCNP